MVRTMWATVFRLAGVAAFMVLSLNKSAQAFGCQQGLDTQECCAIEESQGEWCFWCDGSVLWERPCNECPKGWNSFCKF